VFDHGWYRELPDAAAIKLPLLDEDALYRAMHDLALSPQKRQQMGHAAAQHIQTTHQPARVAEHIHHLLRGYLAQVGAVSSQQSAVTSYQLPVSSEQ
jgi:hypothetical protein